MTISIGGGLGEEYMSAPRLAVGGEGKKGGGGFIASLLDLLGVNHQVAKEPKGEKKEGGQNASPSGKVDPTAGAVAYTPGLNNPQHPSEAPPPPPKASITILDDAQAAFSPLTPQASKFGQGFSMLPLTLR